MSAIELVEFGLKDDAVDHRAATSPFIPYTTSANGSSTPVDVSAHTMLRLDLDARVNLGAAPSARVYWEHAPTAEGPWTTLLERHLTAQNWPPIGTRVLLDGFDRFVRVRWVVNAEAAGPLNFQLGVSGDALPDAA